MLSAFISQSPPAVEMDDRIEQRKNTNETNNDDDHNNDNKSYQHSTRIVIKKHSDSDSISNEKDDRMSSLSSSSSSSSTSSYKDPSTNDLNLISGAALLMADCLGTGILALPRDIQVLGPLWGIGFILLNLPINLYAGTILSKTADVVEREMRHEWCETSDVEERITENGDDDDAANNTETESDEEISDSSSPLLYKKRYDGVVNVNVNDDAGDVSDKTEKKHNDLFDSATFDFIGVTSFLFSSPHSKAARIVTAVFYCNIFLVLGNYILVMSHAVAALIGENRICIPVAGVIASTLMFALVQLNTMAKLGKSASVISLSALATVVVQCLIATDRNAPRAIDLLEEEHSIMRKLAALSSIGFAVGSQKLFLNIRHEMKHRNQAPISLGICLVVFGSVYILVCLMAGSNPPGFLFSTIPSSLNRRIAGLLLWIHVAVSFAINSQALCSSIDRIQFRHIRSCCQLDTKPRLRWMLLTLLTSVSSYIVANAVPFFKDLVALIGALTSIPLTLFLPAILYRKGVLNVDIWRLGTSSVCGWKMENACSYCLVLFSVVFLVCGLFGALFSIELDWASHGPPFACHD